jgi:hypothetical protein
MRTSGDDAFEFIGKLLGDIEIDASCAPVGIIERQPGA